MLKLFGYLKYYKKQAIVGPFCKLIEAIFELIVPLVMARIIDVGIKNNDKNYILLNGGLMVLLGVLGLCFALVCQYYASYASQGVGTRLRNDLFAHINRLSHTELDKIGTASLITRLTNDINQVQAAVAMLIRLVVRAPFLIIGAIVMAMFIDLKLSLVFLIIAPLVALILWIIMSKSVPFYHLIQNKLDGLSLLTRENLSGARVIRAFSKQEQQQDKFDKANQDYLQTAINVNRITSLLNPLTALILNFGILAIIWFGGYRVESGALTQGQIIAFINYMTQILLTLVVLANLIVIFTKASASSARINEVFAMQPSVTESVNAVDVSPNEAINEDKPVISFKDVCFSYAGSQENALNDLSIDVYKNQTIGILGGTGSGKSTLVNLIPRFYDVTNGSISIYGRDIRDYNIDSLRSIIGIVPQNAVLFSGTLRENLMFGNKNATTEQIERAVDIAQASEFIENMPNGYETAILQGGKNLSGGQKQRLTIARALVRCPKILILDDSSSALDYATDANLRRAIKENTDDMIVFIVSQRTNSIMHADKIIVLDDGDVVGIGTHEQLLKECDIYKEIYNTGTK